MLAFSWAFFFFWARHCIGRVEKIDHQCESWLGLGGGKVFFLGLSLESVEKAAYEMVLGTFSEGDRMVEAPLG